MADSIFTKIIKGEIPSHKVHEDNRTMAFMDIHPIQPGMVLVVPKKQVSHFIELPDEDYTALMLTVRNAAKKLKETFPDKPRIGVIIEGFEMPDHVHVKVFPVSSGYEVRQNPDPDSEADASDLAEMAKKLAF
jgi:histidine triad (HIT) family protein